MAEVHEAGRELWEEAYRRRQNFVFCPDEELVRFVARFVRKRIGLDEFQDITDFGRPPRLLDLGCGIGRHIIFAHDMRMDPYGIDFSREAAGIAIEWSQRSGITDASRRIEVGDARSLPWPDGFFDVVVSHGVLDHMAIGAAREVMVETARVLHDGGLAYCNLVSGDDSSHAREYAGEEIVDAEHEHGTIQSYFNFPKLRQLTEGLFTIAECALVRRENVTGGGFLSRYHLVMRKAEGV